MILTQEQNPIASYVKSNLLIFIVSDVYNKYLVQNKHMVDVLRLKT